MVVTSLEPVVCVRLHVAEVKSGDPVHKSEATYEGYAPIFLSKNFFHKTGIGVAANKVPLWFGCACTDKEEVVTHLSFSKKRGRKLLRVCKLTEGRKLTLGIQPCFRPYNLWLDKQLTNLLQLLDLTL